MKPRGNAMSVDEGSVHPAQRQSTQVELNRALHMDEAAFERGARLGQIRVFCGDCTAAPAARASESG